RAYLDIANKDRVLLRPMVFDKLLDVIAARDHKHYVLFTHGTHDGLLMPLTADHIREDKEYGTVQPKANILGILMQIDEVFADQKAARAADAAPNKLVAAKAKPAAIKAANDAALRLWQALLTKIGRPDPVSSSEDAARIVQQWLDSLLRSSLHMTEKQVRGLLDKRQKVRAKQLDL